MWGKQVCSPLTIALIRLTFAIISPEGFSLKGHTQPSTWSTWKRPIVLDSPDQHLLTIMHLHGSVADESKHL